MENLGDYNIQLDAVNKALEASNCQNEKAELLQLKANILELLELTNYTSTTSEEQNEPNDDEMQRFMSEIRGMESNTETKNQLSNESDTLERQISELKADLKKMVGQKCSAPHSHSWGAISYHNAIICDIADAIESNDGSLEARLRVFFTNPTHQEMLPCTYFLEGECRYDETQCYYSHGELVSLSDLRDYVQPDFTLLARNCFVLAKCNDSLWHRGRVLCVNFVEKQCRVRLDNKDKNKREKDYNFEDLLPFHYEELSSGSSSDDSCGTDSEELLDDLEIKRREALVQQSLFNFKPNQALGEWERYTKGIGSRLMEKMGYIHGTGLGSDGQGIVIPISAQILPQGRSLDYCMELREAANGDKNLFSVERKMHRTRKKQEDKNRKAYQRESERTDLFTFINTNVFSIANKDINENTDKSKKINSRLDSQSTKSLNIDSVRIADDIRHKEREISRTKESIQRNAHSTEMQKRIQSQLNLKMNELETLQRMEKNLKKEQASRKTKNKLSIF